MSVSHCSGCRVVERVHFGCWRFLEPDSGRRSRVAKTCREQPRHLLKSGAALDSEQPTAKDQLSHHQGDERRHGLFSRCRGSRDHQRGGGHGDANRCHSHRNLQVPIAEYQGIVRSRQTEESHHGEQDALDCDQGAKHHKLAEQVSRRGEANGLFPPVDGPFRDQFAHREGCSHERCSDHEDNEPLLDLIQIAPGLPHGQPGLAGEGVRHQGEQHRHADKEDHEEAVCGDDGGVAPHQRPQLAQRGRAGRRGRVAHRYGHVG